MEKPVGAANQSGRKQPAQIAATLPYSIQAADD
jgi:hypothetical protein